MPVREPSAGKGTPTGWDSVPASASRPTAGPFCAKASSSACLRFSDPGFERIAKAPKLSANFTMSGFTRSVAMVRLCPKTRLLNTLDVAERVVVVDQSDMRDLVLDGGRQFHRAIPEATVALHSDHTLAGAGQCGTEPRGHSPAQCPGISGTDISARAVHRQDIARGIGDLGEIVDKDAIVADDVADHHQIIVGRLKLRHLRLEVGFHALDPIRAVLDRAQFPGQCIDQQGSASSTRAQIGTAALPRRLISVGSALIWISLRSSSTPRPSRAT